MKKKLDAARIDNQWPALCNAAGQAFCNASPFCLRDLTNRAKKQTLKADFEAYLDSFSLNVQEILDTRFNAYLEGSEQMAMIPRKWSQRNKRLTEKRANNSSPVSCGSPPPGTPFYTPRSGYIPDGSRSWPDPPASCTRPRRFRILYTPPCPLCTGTRKPG